MTERLATGIDILDRKLGGGVPPGTLTTISATPASQSEVFLYDVATNRPTLYLTGIRSKHAVETALTTVESEHEGAVVPFDPTTPRGELFELVEALPPRSNLIVDPALALESRADGRHWEALNGIRSRLEETESVGFLHCLDGRADPPARDLTEYVADAVFELSTERDGDTIENYLAVPKFRGSSAVEDVIKLDLSAGVEVDISRTIV